MGHRLSKTNVNGCNATKLEHKQQQKAGQEQQHNTNQTHHIAPSLVHTSTAAATDSSIPAINLQIQETPNNDNSVQIHSAREEQNSSTCPRQIIIKIQLAKMENEVQQLVNASECCNDNSSSNSSTLSNSNNNGAQFLNLSFNRNTTYGEFQTAHATFTSDTSCLQQRSSKQLDKVMDERTAGGSPSFVVNNNFSPNVVVTSTTGPGRQENFNILMGPMSDLQLDEKRMSVASVVSSTSSSGELATSNTGDCQTEQQAIALAQASNSCTEENTDDYCCRRKSKSNTFPSKWRCYKCTCRDAFKRIIDASSSKSSKKKEQRSSEKPNSPKYQQHSSEQQQALWTPLQTTSPRSSGASLVNNALQNAVPPQMSIWSPSSNDVIIPISSPQFVVVQCPPSSLVTLGRIDDNAIRLIATELEATNSNNAQRLHTTPADMRDTTPASSATTTTSSSSIATPNRGGLGCPTSTTTTAISVVTAGPVVHSQVDYIHCLVPDLERITKSSFYWGKMDRYEAERLLEGKPEGTFLLRDSAQEEYLFSVTFRKYGRSLHARIEQSNHKFSFDCHDPCVFTASTVTGLLEHYKDPACVMFFEPMLTIPLHRNTTFSLQQLCRATIVSNTSYDGINELELPSRLKSYLKEYHYKQKLRVKPFDEPFYSCT